MAASHLLSIVDDVLDLAKIEAGVAEVSTTNVALAEVIEEVRRIAAPLATRRSVTLDVRPIPSTLVVRADPRRLRQALLNVVSNAIKYNRPAGTVRIDIEANPPG